MNKFSFLLSETQHPVHRIAFGSCFNPNRADATWQSILDANPNQLLLLGDQIYPDFHPKTGMWQVSSPDLMKREYEKWQASDRWNSLVKSLSHGWMSTYDDHDYGLNNADKSYIYRNDSQQLFMQYNSWFRPAHDEDKASIGVPGSGIDGVYSGQDINFITSSGREVRYKVIILDSRSNKDKQDLLGEKQWTWLEQQLLPVDNQQSYDFIVLGASVQVIANDRLAEEGWFEYPAQRQRLLSLLAETVHRQVAKQVVIISGDVHVGEMSLLNCNQVTGMSSTESQVTLIDVTSSGLGHTATHSVTKKGIKHRGWIGTLLYNVYQVALPSRQRRLKYRDIYLRPHFAVIDVTEEKNDLALQLRLIDLDGSIGAHRSLPLSTRKMRREQEAVNASDYSSISSSWVCEEERGAPSTYRLFLARFTMSVFLALTTLMPLLFVIWLVVASIIYLCFGGRAEMKRRKKIEREQALKYE